MAEIHTTDDNETEDSPMLSDADEPDDKSGEEPSERRRRAMFHVAQCNFRWSKGDLPAAPTVPSIKFVGILYLSGYVILPRTELFSETADDV
ncbi:hypothetical protein PR048_015339 [Dryococelus australis]|uniref:Uncharacterized protein n=1 Tax=Dryococelus australis TaxID=614101 RepID=A0ABQ9HGY3_9NEOP|nr:hypothetical protein PR048_015339 [Dryococelus australis]